jgi:cytochrome b561
MIQKQRTTYSLRSQFLHALIALLVFIILILGISFERLPDFLSDQAYMIHKSCGLLVLFLMIFRLLFIFKDGRPNLPKHVQTWEKFLSRFVQYSLYLVLILMPISGWVMSVAEGYIPSFFNWFNLDLPFIPLDKGLAKQFANYHYLLAWIIGGLLVFHILGSLKHYFFDKDEVLQSMWKFKK